MLDLENDHVALPFAGSTVTAGVSTDIALLSEPGAVATGSGNLAPVSEEDEHNRAAPGLPDSSAEVITTRLLNNADQALVLDTLGRQPLQNVMLRGTILEYGLMRANNRGSFYGCFRGNCLIGVALIGHTIILQGSQEAIVAFAEVVRRHHASEARMLLAEESEAASFCRLILTPASGLHVTRSTVEILLALTSITFEPADATQLRLALPDEAEEISVVNARGHKELNGFDPSIEDPKGFVERSRIRIEKGRVWVIRDTEGIAFKVDVARVTDEAVYLEGVLTRPNLRGTGLGKAALGDLCQRLLRKHDAVCLLAAADSDRALSFYQRFGFAPIARYRFVRFGQMNS
jgi:GNAT superfamily N-acetyltransferase